jgi:hypothetical protein
VRSRIPVLAATLAIAVLAPAAAAASAPGHAADARRRGPCQSPEKRHLLCPDLRIGPPSDMYMEDAGGRVLLRATSDVRSRGRGPIELRGRRDGHRTMRVVQRIYRRGGGHIDLRSKATLRFTDVGAYFGGSYWKVHELARFELRPVMPGGGLGAAVRTSPKLNYCLRDLERTRPGRASPGLPHYPACSQDPYRDRVTLGTSVGWSDIYPSDYDKQYVDVTGLRGCFAFQMTVDPMSLLVESNDRDNRSSRRVLLPFTGAGC